MEKRNIRWGEILGGLLIVGCSVALVITLWSTIAQYPLLKFGVFTAVVASLFGVGLYAEHRWKLPTTSRGILLIGMLLVPLQFIAMAAMSAGSAMDGGTILGETVSGAIVLWLAILACRVLTPKWAATIATGFVLVAAGVFVIAQNAAAGATAGDVLGLGLPSLLVYLATAGLMIRASWKSAVWDSSQGQGTAQGMGLLFYAAGAAMVFLLAHFSGAAELWRWASPLLMILAIPPMATGMLMSGRLTEPKAVNWRVTGTAIAVASIGLLAISVMCSWPEARFFVPMAVTAACVVAGAALVFGMPWAHVPAGLLLGLAAVVGVAWLRGELPDRTPSARVIEVMLGSGTGIVLTVYSVVAGTIAVGLARWKGKSHAIAWGIVAGASAALSLAWVVFYTYVAPDPIRWGAAVFALYTVIAFAAHWRTRRLEAGLAAWVLLLPMLQRLTHNTPHPWVFAFLDVSALSLLAAIWLRPKERWWGLSGRLAWHVCFIASVITGLMAAGLVGQVSWPQEMLWFATLAAILLLSTVLEPTGHVLATGQIALALCAVSAGVWYGEMHPQMIVPTEWLGWEGLTGNAPAFVRFGKPVLFCLAALGVAWTVLRMTLRRLVGKEPALLKPAVCADRLITIVSLFVLVGVFIGVPTVAAAMAELGGLHGSGSSNPLALMLGGVAGATTWAALGLMITWAALETWHTRSWGWLAADLAGALGACGLIAIGCEPAHSSASSLRWSLMAMMMVGSLPIWFRGRLAAWSAQVGLTRFAAWDETSARTLRACLLLPTVLGMLALTLMASGLNLAGAHIPGPLPDSVFARMGSSVSYLVPLGAIISTLLVYGFRERLQGLILAAAAVTHLAVTLGYLLGADQNRSDLGLMRLMELNAATAALFALGWIGWESAHRRRETPSGVRGLAWAAMLLIAPVIVLAESWLLLSGHSSNMVRLAGLPSAWLGVAGAAAVFWLLAKHRVRLVWLALLTLGLIGLTASSAGHLSVPWLGFHVLLAAYLAAGWGFLLLAEALLQINTDEAQLSGGLPMATATIATAEGPRILSYQSAPQAADPVAQGQIERRRQGIRGWVLVFVAIAVALCLRSLTGDPQRPWWAIGGLFVIDLLAVAIAWKHLRPGYLYPATAAFNLAVSIWWGWYQGSLSNHHWIADLLHLNMLCLAGSGGVAMVLERAVFAPELETGRMWRGRMPALPLQRFAGIVLTLVSAMSAAWVVVNQGWMHAHQTMWLTWAATVATLGLLVSLFWDKGSRLGMWLLYVAALSAVTMLAGSVGLRGPAVLYLMLLLWFAFSVLCLYLSRNLRLVEQWGGEVSADDVRQILAANSILLGIAVLGVPLAEVMEWSATGQVAAIAPWMIFAYLIIAAFTIYVLILAAVKPARLALNLSDTLRMGCVYAAEAMLGIAFLHLRLTMPQLFGGVFSMYWPMVVMAIAFVGVASSEVCRRKGLRVLAEPLEKTGALLPLLPVLGFWVAPSRVDFGGLLLSVGILYGCLALMRRSFGFGLLAILATNGALWSLLHGMPGLGFAEHPQLWSIPLALSVLIAADLNRRQLPPARLAMIRMVCMMGVYISSTADIFINGVAQQPYLPLVLGGLSLAGALAGIWLRVRSMLYLGSGFLLLSIVTVIYHASINLHQTWIIWLVGLACGAGLFAFFAVFEKKRAEVDALIGKLRQWDK